MQTLTPFGSLLTEGERRTLCHLLEKYPNMDPQHPVPTTENIHLFTLAYALEVLRYWSHRMTRLDTDTSIDLQAILAKLAPSPKHGAVFFPLIVTRYVTMTDRFIVKYYQSFPFKQSPWYGKEAYAVVTVGHPEHNLDVFDSFDDAIAAIDEGQFDTQIVMEGGEVTEESKTEQTVLTQHEAFDHLQERLAQWEITGVD